MPMLHRKTVDNKSLNFRRIRQQFVDARGLLDILTTEGKEVAEVRYVNPKIGSHSFGKFRVKWKNNRYGV